MNSLLDLRDQLRQFAEERDWSQFHSPKNLASALTVESAELLEKFQWLTDEQSRSLDEQTLSEVKDEIADVLLYLVQLSDKLDIDPIEAAQSKMVANAAKYPADKARGKHAKYDKL